jgi:hypothetical protein
MDRDSALRKAQKLMAVAMDGRGNDNEAERALAQAEALMRKFGLEDSEVKGVAAEKDFDWGSSFAPYGVPRQPAKSIPSWYGIVAMGVARFTDTIVKQHYNSEKGYGVGFYGEASDVLFAQWLVTYLRDTVWREAKKYGGNRAENGDFRHAMASRLQARMYALRAERDVAFREATNSAGQKGTALMIISDKLVKRDAEFGVQKAKPVKRQFRDMAAMGAGHAAGERVGFNRPVGQTTNDRRIAA